MPARNSCNIHGHHNRNHCIIIHLNTRNLCNYSSQLSPLPRSDNPLQKTRASSCRHEYPQSPTRASRRTKTYSPFKRTFLLPQQSDWETNIQPSKTRPFQERVFDESKLESPCKYNPPTLSKIPGGDGRNRTDDPLLAKQVLYQLSYIPNQKNQMNVHQLWWAREDLNLRPHAYQACALTN